MAVRLSLLSAAVWWAGFTFIPYRGLKQPPAQRDVAQVEGGLSSRAASGSSGQTLKDLRNYPVALTFLLAYLFFNDGIQTVIGQASVYGVEELGFDTGYRAGDLPAGPVRRRLRRPGLRPRGRARRREAHDPVRPGRSGWSSSPPPCCSRRRRSCRSCCSASRSASCSAAPRRWRARTSRCFIPRGKEAEFFSFYHAIDRGTSWFGTLTFGIVYTLTDSYRPAIFALIVFFVIGGPAADAGRHRARHPRGRQRPAPPTV